MSPLLRPSLGALTLALSLAAAQPAAAAVLQGTPPASTDAPTIVTQVANGHGTLITLRAPMSDVFVANDKVADVQVRSPTQLWLFGRSVGETTVYATSAKGAVLWSAQVQVTPDMEATGAVMRGVLSTAMPDAAITVTPLAGGVLLTGTVASPNDVAEATRVVEASAGTDKLQVINRLKAPTALQVSLHVRIAEVSRTLSKQIGVNLLTHDATGGMQFGIGRGTAGTITPGSGGTGASYAFNQKTGATSLGLAGKFLGLDVLSTLDLAETNGLSVTLAEPNLTALSGETASFLAGGEIPVPQSSGLGAVSVSFKQYGVSLAFTPTVLSGGRISLRVRPEVSQITDAGAVKLSDFTIPALTTRRAETTVELGSGQSFVIGGLLQNNHNNSTDKAPFLGDLPILGALFRSNSFKKDETELVIVVTPYLVRPVDAAQIALPTDGYRAASDVARVLGGQPVAGDAPRPATQPSAGAASATAPALQYAPVSPEPARTAAPDAEPAGAPPLSYELLDARDARPAAAAAAAGPRN